MYCQHGGAGLGDGGDALFDRIVDIEQLEVEEHLLARLEQFLAQGEAIGAIEALVADLEEIHLPVEQRHDLLGARA
ncbi:hypothetical protein D3C72_1995570 [compost metagenome]